MRSREKAIERALSFAAMLVLSLGACSPIVKAGPDAPSGASATVCLNADGPSGVDTYEIIRSAFGSNAIELPDAFHTPPFRHVQEADDPDVGPCFVFYMHRDIDGDPNTMTRVDRQRCEMKVYDPSPEHLKGYENTTFTYNWRFKLSATIPVTKNFLHLFQLKAVGSPDDDHPVVTLTGAKVSNTDRIQIRHAVSTDDVVLADADWSAVKNAWLDVHVQAKFSDQGSLVIQLKKSDGTVLLNVNRHLDIDMWRGGGFVRPKWGIYRSLNDIANLINEEDEIRFANIAITPGATASSDCRIP